MLALKLIFAALLFTLGLLLFRHLRLLFGRKDSNNPVQHTVKLPPRTHTGEDTQRPDFGYPDDLFESIMGSLHRPTSSGQSAKEKRKRLFRSKADIRRAFIINELLKPYE